MARRHRHHGGAAEALEELESVADRLSDWLQANVKLVFASVVGVLAVAGAGAWIFSAHAREEKKASIALEEVREDYLTAMGAGLGALEVPELANPEAANRIRSEFRGRFSEVAESYRGTVAGTLADLETARLATESGATDEAIARTEEALENAPRNAALRGMILQRLAQNLESADRWADAAQRHEEAAELDGFPLHFWALADAARCAAQAGDREHALALYDRLEAEAPELRLPDHQRAEVLELRSEHSAS